MTAAPIHYSIRLLNPTAHRLEVRCSIAEPDPAGQRLALPAWIPGSYLIRDFARHIVAIRAESNGRRVPLDKLDKHTWRAAPCRPGAALTVICEVHAWDLSVRGAHVDQTHAFFNGSSVFLCVLGQEDRPCCVDIQPPEGPQYAGWRLATAMRPARGLPGAARRHGFGLYRADDYDELIDHPFEMGRFALATFEACGVPHEVVVSGRHDTDLDRLTRDLQRVCEWQIRFFGTPAPMERYVFLVTAVGEGYGGLEHRASSALLCARNDLPYAGMEGLPEGYRGLLGLCSHEYFHTWNVKRIKPQAFTPYDLARENHTTLLWAFEGFTSYYDDLALLRSGVIGIDDWLESTGKTLSNVQRTPGRRRQSLAESSFDAWSKFYRPDENSPNAVISYYAKGALFALWLDLTLRSASAGRVSLDNVMRELWQRHGMTGVGVAEDGILAIAEECSGLALSGLFTEGVDGTRELPLRKALADFGVKLEWRHAGQQALPSLGVRSSGEPGNASAVQLTTVYDGGPAQQAGLASGDVLLAIDGVRVTPATLDALLARRRAGDALTVHAFRRDELMQFTLTLAPAPTDNARLTLVAADRRRRALRKDWLGQ